jgi:aryl sulfotransferase
LRIHVTDLQISQFATAGTFACMRQRADDLVPDGGNPIWLSNEQFFHRGRSGQWRDLLDSPGLLRYADRVAELAPPDLAAWAHNGWRGAGAPS